MNFKGMLPGKTKSRVRDEDDRFSTIVDTSHSIFSIALEKAGWGSGESNTKSLGVSFCTIASISALISFSKSVKYKCDADYHFSEGH